MYLVYGNNNIAEHVIQSRNEAISYNQIKQILKKVMFVLMVESRLKETM